MSCAIFRVMLCVTLLTPAMLAAHGRKSSSASTTLPPLPSNYRVPRIQQPLHLSDFSGMAPRAELRDKLLHISGFVQRSPKDGDPPSQQTEVWLAYTSTSLYVVFICHDTKPAEIRGHLARRENTFGDDTVSIILDSFQDHRKGILFKLNPTGVQADAIWTENASSDYSYDQVWDSEGKITPDGWMALMAIPFRSLRFRPGVSNWGVVFSRNIPRNSEWDYWPRIAADVSGVLTQEETLRGIEGVTGSRNIQLNPYALSQNERNLMTLDPVDPYFSSRHLEGTVGGEAKAVLKDSIVVDAAVNPDFSDVESEQPQFTVNQRYPVYFPELRPFFLENANYFSTPIRLVYTRNIIHPELGGRVTGKIGHTNIGILATDDRAPGESVALGDPLYNKRALFAVGRVSQDLGEGSSVGLIYTDQEFGQGWNRVGGLDFTWRINQHWTTSGQSVASSTQGSIDDTTLPTYTAGPASFLEFTRSGHAFGFDTVFKDLSPGFQTLVGFDQTTNIRYSGNHVSYRWFPKHRSIQSYGLDLSQSLAWDHEGNRVFHYTNFDPFFQFPRSTFFAPVAGESSDTLGPQNGYNLSQNVNFTENYGGIVMRSAPTPFYSFSLDAFYGGNVNYNPASNLPPMLLHQDVVQGEMTVQPLRQLASTGTYLLDRDFTAANSTFVYEAQTFRMKVNYQFTKAFSARAIVEYDSTLGNPAETSLLRTKEIGTQALLTWLPHPGTALYVGYNNDLQNLDRSLCNRLPDESCDPNNTAAPRAAQFLNDGRQIFVKASYLFRF